MEPGGLDPEIQAFVAEARQFLDSVLSRRTVEATRAPAERMSLFTSSSPEEVDRSRAWQRQVFDAGFGWITGPREFGGRGLPASFERAYLEVEREYDVPPKGPLTVSLGMVVPTIALHATEEVKAAWLAPLRRADAVGCQLFSEPGAGSDLASVATAARRDGEVWRLTGQKVWTSGAHYADVGLALTRTSAGDRHHNLTMFLVDMHAPGVEVRPLRQMTGGADFNEVFFDDVEVADAWRLGDVDGGWRVAMSTLSFERGAIGGSSSGGAGLFRMDDLSAWLRESGSDEDPAVVDAFARLYTGVTAAKAMRRRGTGDMALSKLLLTANLTRLADLVTLALGRELVADTGRTRTFAWSEFVLGVPGMRVGGGTDEIMRNTVAERTLQLPREPR
jgi:alkylation response protein AidB-like acyl-CoA dehydrogenase